MMKKIEILLLAVLATALLGSCEDKSGTYAEQYYTNTEKNKTIYNCLDTCLGVAANNLCKLNGYSQHDGGIYKIDYAPISYVLDTLSEHQQGWLADSLVFFSNRMAESSGTVVRDAFSNAINKLVVYDPDELLDGNSALITAYFKQMKYRDIEDAFATPLSVRISVFEVNYWLDEVLRQYYNITTTVVSFDLQDYLTERMMDGIFEEMSKEEILTRTDTLHRFTGSGLLNRD